MERSLIARYLTYVFAIMPCQRTIFNLKGEAVERGRSADFVELSDIQIRGYEQAVLKPGANVACHGFPLFLKKNL
jgi:hypothetical protein